jgi:hypothetical protein
MAPACSVSARARGGSVEENPLFEEVILAVEQTEHLIV